MEEKIKKIIPTLMEEMSADEENQSSELFKYYKNSTTKEKTVVNEIMMYISGWSFETLLEKCGIKVAEDGNPIEH